MVIEAVLVRVSVSVELDGVVKVSVTVALSVSLVVVRTSTVVEISVVTPVAKPVVASVNVEARVFVLELVLAAVDKAGVFEVVGLVTLLLLLVVDSLGIPVVIVPVVEVSEVSEGLLTLTVAPSTVGTVNCAIVCPVLSTATPSCELE